MPENNAGTRRQRGNVTEQCLRRALISEEPDARQNILVLVGQAYLVTGHQPAIGQKMSSENTDSNIPLSPSGGESSGGHPLDDIQKRITAQARLADRAPNDITLIAVSKTRSAEQIAPLIAAGHRHFGENRVQEAAGKWPELSAQDTGLKLHMIGQLQSNKAAEAVALFDMIHSVDRLSLIKALGKAMASQDRQIDCLLQVNIGGEEQKGGCAIGDIGALLEAAKTHGVPVTGLMCIPPADMEPAPHFALLDKLTREFGLAERSMGMSNDYDVAVTLGATMVRVGSALFGPRDY